MSKVHWLVVVFLGVAAIFPAVCQAQPRPIPFSDEAVATAIDKAKEFLWSQYRLDPRQDPWPDRPTKQDGKKTVPYENYGGYSAMPMYALLAAGEKYNDRRMKRALNWLARIDTKGTYTLGVRMQIWAYLPEEIGRPLMVKDADRLVKSINQPAPGEGFTDSSKYSYGTYSYISSGKARSGGDGDHSNTQFGQYGVWAAARCNIDVPLGYWELVYKHWMMTQNPEGGWGYGIGPVVRGSHTMTAAGLASLYVASDNLFRERYITCGQNPADPAIERALGWFDRNFGGSWNHYYLYGVERIGLASGHKYFGKKNWYKLGATRLINTQQGNGAWGNIVNTSFALLFLARGRAPVMVNRLKYPGTWNNRPRALSNLTGWVSRKFEHELNWQIINLEVPVEKWHDASILLISGSTKPSFSPADLDKLRKFVWQGGMILSIAEGGSRGAGFQDGMCGPKGVYSTLFPNYELKQLGQDHLIFRAQFKIHRRLKLWGISNGIRLLALHTTEDLPLPWQRNAYVTSLSEFQLGANIAFFVNDRKFGRPRGTSHWPEKKSFVPLRAVRVTRVKHSGNWEPEPLAWERFKLLMGQKWQTNVILGGPVTLEDLDAGQWPIAAMTGTGALTLSKGEKAALKAYVQGGGTVVMDAAGGSKAFASSAVELLEELFGADSFSRVPSSAKVYGLAGMKVESVAYRRAARSRTDGSNRPRLWGVLLGGRTAVFLSKEGLTGAMVGYPSYTAVSYRPDSAVELMRNIVLYGAGLGRKRAVAAETAEPSS